MKFNVLGFEELAKGVLSLYVYEGRLLMTRGLWTWTWFEMVGHAVESISLVDRWSGCHPNAKRRP
jgi:hypothetical protein